MQNQLVFTAEQLDRTTKGCVAYNIGDNSEFATDLTTGKWYTTVDRIHFTGPFDSKEKAGKVHEMVTILLNVLVL